MKYLLTSILVSTFSICMAQFAKPEIFKNYRLNDTAYSNEFDNVFPKVLVETEVRSYEELGNGGLIMVPVTTKKPLFQNVSIIDQFKNNSKFCAYNPSSYGVSLDYTVYNNPCYVEIVGVPEEELFLNSGIRKSLRLALFHSHKESTKDGKSYLVLHNEFNRESKDKITQKYIDKYGKPDSTYVVKDGFESNNPINFTQFFWFKNDFQITLFVGEDRYTKILLETNPTILKDLIKKDYCSYDYMCDTKTQKINSVGYFHIVAHYELYKATAEELQKKFHNEFNENIRKSKQSKF